MRQYREQHKWSPRDRHHFIKRMERKHVRRTQKFGLDTRAVA